MFLDKLVGTCLYKTNNTLILMYIILKKKSLDLTRTAHVDSFTTF